MPAKFFPLPSKNPAMHGGPLLLSFGYHSPEAMNHCCDSDDELVINTRFPTFRNEISDCLRTGMLSALHYLDPECRMDMTGLRKIMCDNKDTGTSIATAALIFNRLGIAAHAYASSLERVEQGPCELAQELGVIEQRILTQREIMATVYHGHIVICAIDPYAVYDNAYSCSHAVLVTGSGDDLLTVHDSMRPPEAPGSHGERNSMRLWKDIEAGRAAHDYHTLVINGRVPDLAFHRQAMHAAISRGAKFTGKLLNLQSMLPPPELPGMAPKVDGVYFTPHISETFTNTVPFVCNTANSSVAAAGLSAMRYYNRTQQLDLGNMAKKFGRKKEQIEKLAAVFDKLAYKAKLHKGRARNLTQEQLRKTLIKKQLPICTVDYNKLHKRKTAKVQPHAVCLVGFDYDQVILHESGSSKRHRPHTPYLAVPQDLFERSRISHAPTLVAQGRRIKRTRILSGATTP